MKRTRLSQLSSNVFIPLKDIKKVWCQRAIAVSKQLAAAVKQQNTAKDACFSWNHFWRLYYGELILVEKSDVATAMENLGEELNGRSVE